jgi:DNA-binding transcriptional MocR family regulator
MSRLDAAAHGAVGSQLALAQHLGIDRTVMTYLLDDLEAAGLIERRPDPADRRARRVVATQLGMESSSPWTSDSVPRRSSFFFRSMASNARASAGNSACWRQDSTHWTRSTTHANWRSRLTPSGRRRSRAANFLTAWFTMECPVLTIWQRSMTS